jgi:anaerobic ribonucleoside-triphosphate reductase activating protein
LRCQGCFNPALHSFARAKVFAAKKLARFLAAMPGDGLTVSGGEPFDQAWPLAVFLRQYKAACNKTIIVFSGYDFSELKASRTRMKAAFLADAIISGRYKKGEHWDNKKLILLTGRIQAHEMSPHNSIEMAVANGSALITGYPLITHI